MKGNYTEAMVPVYPLRIGLFSIGLEAYWAQFSELKERLLSYNHLLAERIVSTGVELENAGLVDTPERALAAGHAFRAADVRLLFLHVATYALSATVLPVVRRLRCPVIVLNLAPGEAIDYEAFHALEDREAMTGEWLSWCQACPVPEIANVFRRARVPFFQLSGVLAGDQKVEREMAEWIEAAQVAHALEHNRMGLLGHYYSGMLDIYTDLTGVCATFGGHMELLEVDELSALRGEVDEGSIHAKRAAFGELFEVGDECSAEELDRAARTAVALDRLVARHDLTSMAYYYRGAGNAANTETMSSIILGTSLLTARGVPVAGEYEVKNAIAMKVLERFGAGGSFSEFYATDLQDDVVLLGHDGPGHLAIAEGRVRVRPLRVYHGKVGQGLSVEMSVRHGPVTLLSVAEADGDRLRFVIAEGEAVPGPTLQIGNTNSRYRFGTGARRFVEAWSTAGPAHHCAIGVGHIASKLEKLAAILQLEFVRIR